MALKRSGSSQRRLCWQIAFQGGKSLGSSRQGDPAKGVTDLAQAVLTLRGVLAHGYKIGCSKALLPVTDIRWMGLSWPHSKIRICLARSSIKGKFKTRSKGRALEPGGLARTDTTMSCPAARIHPRPIEGRSKADREPIESRSRADREPIESRSRADREPIESRSRADFSCTEARSKPDWMPIETSWEANQDLIWGKTSLNTH
jgi:hypothetical protein